MYKVKMYHLRRNVKFVIMKSVFDTDVTINEFYDLKGSSVGRTAKVTESVKKDNDLRSLMASARDDGEKAGGGGEKGGKGTTTTRQRGILCLRDARESDGMRAALVADLNFFKSKNVIDYSMLVGVGDEGSVLVGRDQFCQQQQQQQREICYTTSSCSDYDALDDDDNNNDSHRKGQPRPPSLSSRKDGGFRLYDSPKVAYFGVIDVLQTYTPRKFVEAQAKAIMNAGKGGREGVSCCNPRYYADRFLRFFDFYVCRGEETQDVHDIITTM